MMRKLSKMTDRLQSDEKDAAALLSNNQPSTPDLALLISRLKQVRSALK